MKIDPSETVLTGHWLVQGGRVMGDQTCDRIDELVRTHLRELGRDWSGWEALYRDPDDGRLWEMAYPQGDLQGGGPPELRCLSLDEARKKYGSAMLGE